MLHKLTPIILAGGQGSRLKPFTSNTRPKPFLKVASRLTLLQETLQRCAKMAAPIIICDAKWTQVVQAQCHEISITPRIIIAEPVPRSTAPAIAAAVLGMKPDEPFIVMPSDHIIEDTRAFEVSVTAALTHLKKESIISLGVTPKTPLTRYGYIQKGKKSAETLYQSLGFKEKPNVETAQKFKNSDEYMWNTGVFLGYSGNIVQKFEELCPEIASNIKKDAIFTDKEVKVMSLNLNKYQNITPISIDVAILEKGTHMYVATLSSDWRDIGTLPSFFYTWLRRLFAIIRE